MGEYFPSLPLFGRTLWRAARATGRGLRHLGRAMLYILPVVVLLHLVAVVVTGRQLNADIQRLTEAGIIVPREQLIPRLPEGAANAADVYTQAWDALRLSKEDDATLFYQYAKHDAAWLAVARRVVTDNQKYYRLLDRATAIPDCVFPVNWVYPPAATFPHFIRLRQSARMLTLRASVAAADGRTEEALQPLADCMRISKHAQTDPTIIGDLVSYAIQGIAVRELQEVLAQNNPTPKMCRILADEIARIDNLSSSNRTMRGELVLCGVTYFELFRSGKISGKYLLIGEPAESDKTIGIRAPVPLQRKLQVWIARPILNIDQRYYLDYMSSEVKSFSLPWPESKEAIEDVSKRLETQTPWYATLTSMIMPVFLRVNESRDRATAAIDAAQVALAVDGYRAEHSAYPASLSDVAAADWKLPSDPFGGEPFHYRPEGKGFVVWSIGPDMEDDHAGKDYETYVKTSSSPAGREKNRYDYDIVFRVSR